MTAWFTMTLYAVVHQEGSEQNNRCPVIYIYIYIKSCLYKTLTKEHLITVQSVRQCYTMPNTQVLWL